MSESQPTRYSFRQLTELDHLDVEALRSLYAIELGGEDFYNALADRIDHDAAAELLRRNGREEAGHARRVGRAITLKLGSDFEPTPDLLERDPVALPDSLDPRLFAQLIDGERSGDDVYERWAAHEADPEVARLLRLNGREESIHAGRVQQVIALVGSSESA
jgi:rubrerythrin